MVRKSYYSGQHSARFYAITLILGAFFFFSATESFAQIRTDAPYLVPQTIFVGDRGRLVVPLSSLFSGAAPFVLDNPGELPQSPDLLIRRIELERRGGSSRLLIDFIPFAPGMLYLPDLEFLFPKEGSDALPALKIQVATILTPTNMALSEPASPLTVPGTSLLIYGTVILVLIILFAGIGFSILGPRYFPEFWERFHRRYRLRGMARFLRRLRQECSQDKDIIPGNYLTILSAKWREFLSLFTGINCQSLTAVEFLELPLEGTALDPGRLCRLFRNWDTLRFSGQGMSVEDLFAAMDEVNKFVIALDNAERKKMMPQSPVMPGMVTESNAFSAGGRL